MRRQAQHTKPAPRPWDAPGFTFLPRDANGVCLFPKGYEPMAFATARSVARVEADMRQHEHVAEQRRRAIGWAGNTFDMANTPHNQAAPAMMAARLDGDLPAARKAARPARHDGWGVLPNSHIWLTLELIAHLRRPVTMGELADELRRSKNIVRASLDVWLKRGVLRQVPSREQPLVTHGTHPPKDFARGAKAAQVWLRAGARWA